MSLHLPSQRGVRFATSLTASKPPLSFVVRSLQRRSFSASSRNLALWNLGFGKRKSQQPSKAGINPLTEEFLKRKPKSPPAPVPGDLSESSIFEDEQVTGQSSKTPHDPKSKKGKDAAPPPARNPEYMAAALDPDPASRRRWERKMLIREITKRGRLTKTQLVKKQERQLISKSHDFSTSVKKLVPLAKQITGKTINEAIIQMRFSVKKAANDVRAHLEHAKNEAIVKRGMGLEGDLKEPINILTKKGKRVRVKNLTTMYIEQAWCGKGLFGKTPDFRARGQTNVMKNRTTSLTVVLKEEKTRLRLNNEREEKEKKRRVWVQLPNRPITAQRQYYSW